jgi:hypothetical protein
MLQEAACLRAPSDAPGWLDWVFVGHFDLPGHVL